MITQYLKAPPFEYIVKIVCVQLALACGLATLTLLLLIYRNWSKARVERQKVIFADRLVTEALNLSDTSGTAPLIGRPKWYQLGQRRSLRAVLLELLTCMSGPEKIFLTKRYIDLGFSKRDLRATRSIFWWRRLRALSNLAHLSSDQFAPTFHLLTGDRNELVAAFAYIPLSALNHPLNQIQSVESLPAAVLKRKNVVHEILKNWCNVYGHQSLVSQIYKIRKPDLITMVIRSLATMPTPEIAEAFTQALGELKLSAEAIEQILILIKNVGDPLSAPTVKPYLKHPTEGIRLRALEYFIAIGDTQTLVASGIYADQAVSIRRVLQIRDLGRAS